MTEYTRSSNGNVHYPNTTDTARLEPEVVPTQAENPQETSGTTPGAIPRSASSATRGRPKGSKHKADNPPAAASSVSNLLASAIPLNLSSSLSTLLGTREDSIEDLRASPEVVSGELTDDDISALKVSQDVNTDLKVKRIITKVPLRKPSRNVFFRVRPGEAWRMTTLLLEDPEANDEFYTVSRSLWDTLGPRGRYYHLFVAINRQKTLFVLPVPVPDARKPNDWHLSLLDAVRMAETEWVRAEANMDVGMRDIHVAEGTLSEPEWPELAFNEIIRLAFRGRHVNSLEHPLIQRLEGRA
jgi:hypothetical protein